MPDPVAEVERLRRAIAAAPDLPLTGVRTRLAELEAQLNTEARSAGAAEARRMVRAGIAPAATEADTAQSLADTALQLRMMPSQRQQQLAAEGANTGGWEATPLGIGRGTVSMLKMANPTLRAVGLLPAGGGLDEFNAREDANIRRAAMPPVAGFLHGVGEMLPQLVPALASGGMSIPAQAGIAATTAGIPAAAELAHRIAAENPDASKGDVLQAALMIPAMAATVPLGMAGSKLLGPAAIAETRNAVGGLVKPALTPGQAALRMGHAAGAEAVSQAPVGAGMELLDAAIDPNREATAESLGTAALTNAVVGGATGGLLHPIADLGAVRGINRIRMREAEGRAALEGRRLSIDRLTRGRDNANAAAQAEMDAELAARESMQPGEPDPMLAGDPRIPAADLEAAAAERRAAVEAHVNRVREQFRVEQAQREAVAAQREREAVEAATRAKQEQEAQAARDAEAAAQLKQEGFLARAKQAREARRAKVAEFEQQVEALQGLRESLQTPNLPQAAYDAMRAQHDQLYAALDRAMPGKVAGLAPDQNASLFRSRLADHYASLNRRAGALDDHIAALESRVAAQRQPTPAAPAAPKEAAHAPAPDAAQPAPIPDAAQPAGGPADGGAAGNVPVPAVRVRSPGDGVRAVGAAAAEPGPGGVRPQPHVGAAPRVAADQAGFAAFSGKDKARAGVRRALDRSQAFAKWLGRKAAMLSEGAYDAIWRPSHQPARVVSVFGGSGLVAKAMKRVWGDGKVQLNDFDKRVVMAHEEMQRNPGAVAARAGEIVDAYVAEVTAPMPDGSPADALTVANRIAAFRERADVPDNAVLPTDAAGRIDIAARMVIKKGPKIGEGLQENNAGADWERLDANDPRAVGAYKADIAGRVSRHSAEIQGVEITNRDAWTMLDDFQKGDEVELDPPYPPLKEDGKVAGYKQNSGLPPERDLERIEGAVAFIEGPVRRAVERGVHITYTNYARPEVVAALNRIGVRTRIVERNGMSGTRVQEVVGRHDTQGYSHPFAGAQDAGGPPARSGAAPADAGADRGVPVAPAGAAPRPVARLDRTTDVGSPGEPPAAARGPDAVAAARAYAEDVLNRGDNGLKAAGGRIEDVEGIGPMIVLPAGPAGRISGVAFTPVQSFGFNPAGWLASAVKSGWQRVAIGIARHAQAIGDPATAKRFAALKSQQDLEIAFNSLKNKEAYADAVSPIQAAVAIVDGKAAGTLRAAIKLRDTLRGEQLDGAISEEVAQVMWRLMNDAERRGVLVRAGKGASIKGKSLSSLDAEEVGQGALRDLLANPLRTKAPEVGIIRRIVGALGQILRIKGLAKYGEPVIPPDLAQSRAVVAAIRDGSIWQRQARQVDLPGQKPTSEAFATRPPDLMQRAEDEGRGGGFVQGRPEQHPEFVSGHEHPFKHIANLQRHVANSPEDHMRDAQRLVPGVAGNALEHGGDFLHRMTEHWASRNDWGRGDVIDKADKVIRTLDSPYGFAREHAENIEAQARVSGFSADELKQQHAAVVSKYVATHAALPAYNRPQRLARDASVQVGKAVLTGRTGDAIRALRALKKAAESPDWIKEAGAVEPHADTGYSTGRPVDILAEAETRGKGGGAVQGVSKLIDPTHKAREASLAEADDILADADRLTALTTKAEGGELLNDAEMIAYKQLLHQNFAALQRSSDPRTVEKHADEAFRMAVVDDRAGTNVARALAARNMALDTAAGRRAYLTEMVAKPTKLWQERVDRAKTPAAKAKVRREWADSRRKLINRVAERYGIKLDSPDLGRGMNRDEAYAVARIVGDEAVSMGIENRTGWAWRMLPAYITGNLLSPASLTANIAGGALFAGEHFLHKNLTQRLTLALAGDDRAASIVAANRAATAATKMASMLAASRTAEGWKQGRWLSEDISSNLSIGETATKGIDLRDPFYSAGEAVGGKTGGRIGATLRALSGPAREGVILLDEATWQYQFTKEAIRQARMAGITDAAEAQAWILSPEGGKARDAAAEHADRFTLRSAPETALGQNLMKILDGLTAAGAITNPDASAGAKIWHNLAATVLPFKRALVNLSERAVRTTLGPVEGLRAMYELYGPNGARAMRKRGLESEDVAVLLEAQQKVDIAARRMTYALLSAGVYGLAALGVPLPLTMEEQSDPDRRRVLEASRNTRELPGGVAVTRVEPFAPAALGARALGELAQDLAKGEYARGMSDFASRMTNVNLNRSLLAGPSQLLQGERDPVTGEPKSGGRVFFENIADVAAPGRPWITGERMLTDDRPNTAAETGAGDVVYGPRKPVRDFFGQEAEFRHRNVAARLFLGGQKREDPEAIAWAKRLDETNRQIADMRRAGDKNAPKPWFPGGVYANVKIGGKDYRLSPEELEAYKSDVGGRVREHLAKTRWDDSWPPARKLEVIKRAFEVARAQARPAARAAAVAP